MYEYIKGKKIQLDEHMLSSSELATMYGLQTENGQPHSLMVSAILREYARKTNLNIAEYYYAHNRGCMRVYPELLWKPAMSEFAYHNDIDIDNGKQTRIYKIDYEKKKFAYVVNKNIKQQKIIDLKERMKRNGY